MAALTQRLRGQAELATERVAQHAIEKRREAIVRALEAAKPNDVVVLAGKGHETYQVTAGRSEPFDDRLVARESLVQLARARGQTKG